MKNTPVVVGIFAVAFYLFDFDVGTKPTKYDFKRLFTISEYYDRDRATFYRTIQGVRDRGMDMTGWSILLKA